MTIQRIGKKANAAPSAALNSVWLTGIPKAAIATTSATTRDTTPAIHALMPSTPRRTNKVISGIAAHRAESPRDPPTGSSTCLNIVLTSLVRGWGGTPEGWGGGVRERGGRRREGRGWGGRGLRRGGPGGAGFLAPAAGAPPARGARVRPSPPP